MKLSKRISELLYSFLFFICFFRISFIFGSFYLSYFVGVAGFLIALKSCYARFVFNSIGLFSLISFGFLVLLSLVTDVVTGALFINPTASFAVRLVSMIFLSILPAFFIVVRYLKGDLERLIRVVYFSFSVQLLLFIVSYAYPPAKIIFYNLMGASESVNLSEMNIGLRGFGMSNEINFMSPFLMVVISFILFKGIVFKVITFSSQMINSNNAVVAFALSIIFSRTSIFYKLIIFGLSCVGFIYLAQEFAPRLISEIESGGQRTIGFLIDEHLYSLASNCFEIFIGTSRYIYNGADEKLSDIGYVIIYNYGGILYLTLFLAFMTNLIYRATKNKKWPYSRLSIFLLLFISFLILNFKGLVLGANGFMFFLFLILFNNKYESLISKLYRCENV